MGSGTAARTPAPRPGGGRRLLVIGGGPVGLEAALYALKLGYDARVLEAGEVGQQVLDWGFLRMFSPWKMNCSPLGLRLLAGLGVRPYEDGSSCPTGREFVRRYLVPLHRRTPLRGRVARGTRVLAIGREGLLKGDLIGRPERALRPFRVLAARGGRETVHHADLVIDTTGTYGRHRHMGEGGIPAPGEVECEAGIDYRLVDLEGRQGRVLAGRRVLLVGSGHSAATAATALASLVRKDPRTRVLWAVRGDREPLYPRRSDDPLPERDRLVAQANAIARGSVGGIELLRETSVEAIEPAGSRRPGGSRGRPPFKVTLRTGGRRAHVVVDRILAHVGYAPDRSIHAELQVQECYATEGPIKLAAALLGEGAGSGDCLAQGEMRAELLRNPEPGFFILGSKSYGRNSAFLLKAGHDQIRQLFAMLQGDETLDLYRPPAAARLGPAPLPAGRAPQQLRP